MNELFTIAAGVIVALQGWILLEIISLKVNIGRHDTQIGRIVSDIESEKGTRKRTNSDIETRLRVLERHHEKP